MKKTKEQKKALELLRKLGTKMGEDPDPKEETKLAAKLEKSLTFKDKETHEKWLNSLFSFKFWEDFEELTKVVIKDMKNEKIESILELKKIMEKVKDKRVYARVTRVASNGMSRSVTFRVVTKEGELLRIDPFVKKILGYPWAKKWTNGLVIRGCGLDVIFNALCNINSMALHQGIIKTSKNRNEHDLRHEGIVNTNYWTL